MGQVPNPPTPSYPEPVKTPPPSGPAPLARPASDAASTEPAGPHGQAVASRAQPGRLELVEFRDMELKDAIRLFSEQTGLNIVASSEARKVLVSLYLRDVTPEAALDALAKTHDLWYRSDPENGIIRIYTTKEYQRDLTSFRDERTEVFTLLYPNPIDVAYAIQSLYGDRVILNAQSNASETYQDLEERFDRFDIVNEQSQSLGFFSGSNGGYGGSGYGSSGYGGGGSSFGSGYGGSRGYSSGGGYGSSGRVRRQDMTSQARLARQDTGTRQVPLREQFKNLTAEEIAALESVGGEQTERQRELIEQLMARRQASIYVTVIRPHNQLLVRTSDEKTMQQIRDLISRLDVPTPLVLLEVKILQVDLGDDFNSVFDYQFSDGHTVAGGFTSGEILAPLADNPAAWPTGVTRRDLTLRPRQSTVDGDTTGTSGLRNEDMMFQVVSNNFRFRMQLLEDNNRVTTLATPLLLTANNEVSRLFVGEEVPLNRSFSGQTVTETSAGTTSYGGGTDIEFRPVGTSLVVTANINADRTVTLRVMQELSKIKTDGATVYVPSDTGYDREAIDTVQSRTVSGTVVAMDGLTVAIGGLIDEELSDTRSEVPILGKLPVVGFFFRRQSTIRKRSELVILIRPYVFNTPAENAATSCKLMQDLSLHPKICNPQGTMTSFLPHEVLRANPPCNECQKVFRFHSLEPKRY